MKGGRGVTDARGVKDASHLVKLSLPSILLK